MYLGARGELRLQIRSPRSGKTTVAFPHKVPPLGHRYKLTSETRYMYRLDGFGKTGYFMV
jgi:hypothetical protein